MIPIRAYRVEQKKHTVPRTERLKLSPHILYTTETTTLVMTVKKNRK